MAVSVPSGWRPTLPDSVPQSLKDAIRIIYEKHDDLESNTASAIQKVDLTASAANDAVQQNALATESLLTTIPGYALLQAGSSSQLRQGQGSILPISSGSLLYDNSLAGTIKWYFSGLKISWPDGSTTPIPDTTVALPSIIVTGLSAGSYVFYPYYNINLKVVQWAAAPGGVGAPAVAYSASSALAAQIQNQDGFVAIGPGGGGGVSATATSGGGGGGSGGGRRGYGGL
jgi:hypothetical protein